MMQVLTYKIIEYFTLTARGGRHTPPLPSTAQPHELSAKYAFRGTEKKKPGMCRALKVVELACKPGSVEDNHSSGMPVTRHLKRPTRPQCGSHL